MIPFILSGVYVGEMIGFSLSGYLANSEMYINGDNYGGWPSIFYVFGLAGLVWFPLWAIAAHESPSVHPYISKEESLLINRGIVIFVVLNLIYSISLFICIQTVS